MVKALLGGEIYNKLGRIQRIEVVLINRLSMFKKLGKLLENIMIRPIGRKESRTLVSLPKNRF
jgi:hypothetical protein